MKRKKRARFLGNYWFKHLVYFSGDQIKEQRFFGNDWFKFLVYFSGDLITPENK